MSPTHYVSYNELLRSSHKWIINVHAVLGTTINNLLLFVCAHISQAKVGPDKEGGSCSTKCEGKSST